MRRVILTVVSLCITLLVLGCARTSCAQAPQLRGPDTSVGAVLRSLASRAGVVFVGRVMAIVARDGGHRLRDGRQPAVNRCSQYATDDDDRADRDRDVCQHECKRERHRQPIA